MQASPSRAPVRLDTARSWTPAELVQLRAGLQAQQQEWDLVVVGAGITGAGVARDAALRGLRVLVVEARDVGSGTSSRSSRLIHGGVRYLEQANFRLVFEAIRERQLLLQLAPHLVRPHRFLLTSYRGDRVGPLRLRLGLGLYDALSLWRAHGHTYLDRARAVATEPLLAPESLAGAVMYDDAVTDDLRLTLTVIQDARRRGAEVLTYAPVEIIEATQAGYRVELAGGASVRCKQVVVATGPWTSSKLLGEEASGLLTLSKGIHLVFRHDDLPVAQPVVIQIPGGRRLMFMVPWGTRTYLGTTDVPYSGDPADCRAEADGEVGLIELAQRYVPQARISPDRIVSAWAGVRPLVSARSGAGSTEELSRSHQVILNAKGVIGLVGGKLTTYRAMAEEAVDLVCKRLGRSEPGRKIEGCTTRITPLVPGSPLSPDELADPLIRDLAPRHGPLARQLAARAKDEPELAGRLVDDLPYRWVEIRHALDHEGCTRLDDVLRRRLPLALTDPRLGAAVALPAARWLVDALGGSGRDVEDQLARYADTVEGETRRRPDIAIDPPRRSAAPH